MIKYSSLIGSNVNHVSLASHVFLDDGDDEFDENDENHSLPWLGGSAVQAKLTKTQVSVSPTAPWIRRADKFSVSSRGVAAITVFDSAVAGRQSCVNAFSTRILDVRSCRERIVPAPRPDRR